MAKRKPKVRRPNSPSAKLMRSQQPKQQRRRAGGAATAGATKPRSAARVMKPARATKPTRVTEPTHTTPHFPIVGIGASAGGLEACSQLLQALPQDVNFAIIIVQHLAP